MDYISFDVFRLNSNQDPFFAHPIDSPLRSKWAMENPNQCIDWAQAQIFGVKPDQVQSLIRQGDIALLPSKLPSKAALQPFSGMNIRDSHLLSADQLYKCPKGHIYAINPHLKHLPNQHKIVKRKGIFKVLLGQRSENWGFTEPTKD